MSKIQNIPSYKETKSIMMKWWSSNPNFMGFYIKAYKIIDLGIGFSNRGYVEDQDVKPYVFLEVYPLKLLV